MSQVVIYSTPTCVYCKAAKEYFTQNKVAYTEHNVAEDEKALEEMQTKSGQFGVPVIDIDGNIIVGFDKSAIAKLLKLS